MVDVGDDPGRGGRRGRADRPSGRRRGDGEEWAERLGTIAYEIVCGIGPRAPRVYARWQPGPSRRRPGHGGRRHRGGRGVRGRAGRGPAPPRAGRPGCRRRARAADGQICSLPSHDGGSINVMSRGEGPPIVLSHGVTLSVRTWVKQMEDAARRRASGSSRSTTAATASRPSVITGTRSTRSPTTCARSSRGSTCTTWCSSVTRWVASRCRCCACASPRSSPSGWPASCCSRRWPRPTSAATGASPRRWSGSRRRSRTLAAARARELGLLVCRLGFGRHPQPSHVELTRQMILACDPGDPSRRRRRCCSVSISPRSLPKIAVPTLVIGGTADLVTPPAESRRIAGLVPGARLEMLEGARPHADARAHRER